MKVAAGLVLVVVMLLGPLGVPMSGNNTPADLTQLLRKLEHRIRDLETGQQARRTGQEGGSFIIDDEDEVTRIELGAITHPITSADTYGLRAYDSDGRDVFLLTDNGLEIPAMVASTHNPSAGNSTTSTSYATMYRFYFPRVPTDGFRYRGQISCGAGISTASVRLRAVDLDTATEIAVSDDKSLTCDASFHTYLFDWLHQADLDTVNPEGMVVTIQTKVDTGSGTITVADPQFGILTGGDVIAATTSGVLTLP
jgi:hypothetical protein